MYSFYSACLGHADAGTFSNIFANLRPNSKIIWVMNQGPIRGQFMKKKKPKAKNLSILYSNLLIRFGFTHCAPILLCFSSFSINFILFYIKKTFIREICTPNIECKKIVYLTCVFIQPVSDMLMQVLFQIYSRICDRILKYFGVLIMGP